MRKYISLTLAICFIVLLISTIGLRFHTYRFIFRPMHVYSGYLFFALCLAHIYINRKALVSYMKKSKNTHDR